MIDFHTHILPGVDDGSKSVAESLGMLREESKQGIQKLVLTPHFYAHENSPEQFLARRNDAWEQLSPVLNARMPKIYLGAEVQYFEGICQVEELPRLCVEGSDLLLLEMPFSKWSDRIIQDVLTLNDREDIQIVLAHIDRYLSMQSKETWQILLENGVLMQVNASFFLHWKTKHKAMKMLKKGQIHLLGSDCHNMTHRPPNLGNVYRQIGSHASILKEVL